jgi:HAD superfamily hydrolase (TIGR01509 family)
MPEVYVFDLDGTLVDSMPYFTRTLLGVLDDAGIPYPDDLIKTLTALGYTKSAELFVEMGVRDTVENIVARIKEKLVYEYANNIRLKAGVREYLDRLHKDGKRLFVLTASPHTVTDICLQHNGVYDWFEIVWSVEDFALSKSDTRIFHRVAQIAEVSPSEVQYFDDNLIALTNARRAGFCTYGIRDRQDEEEIPALKAESDVWVESFTQFLEE